jgi:hypothetical protein
MVDWQSEQRARQERLAAGGKFAVGKLVAPNDEDRGYGVTQTQPRFFCMSPLSHILFASPERIHTRSEEFARGALRCIKDGSQFVDVGKVGRRRK